MISPAHRSPLARACRAWIFALICVLLSASGHTLTSAHTISMSTLALAVAFLAALAWSVADRQRGLLPLTAGLLAGQGLLHLWFTADPAGDHAEAVGRLAETRTPAMLLGHCLAAILCGVWLWCGERTAFSLASALYSRILVPLLALLPLLPVTCAAVTARPRAESAEPAAVAGFLRHALARRGPPTRGIAFLTISRDGVTV